MKANSASIDWNRCLPRDEMFDTPRDARGVQRRLGSKLHHKGVLDGEGTCWRGPW